MLISILPPPTSEILYNILVHFAAVMFAYITLEPGTVSKTSIPTYYYIQYLLYFVLFLLADMVED